MIRKAFRKTFDFQQSAAGIKINNFFKSLSAANNFSELWITIRGYAHVYGTLSCDYLKIYIVEDSAL